MSNVILTAEEHRIVCDLLQDEDRVRHQYRIGEMPREEAMPRIAELHSQIDAIKRTNCRCLACREVRG